MYIPHIVNEKTVTVILDGKPQTISQSHPNFLKIKSNLLAGNHDSIAELIDVKSSLVKLGNGDIEIIGNSVRYQGRLVPNYQSEKLISMYRQGHKNINPLKNFICRLMQNPSARARDEFARFADYKELPFDEDGFIYAYKGLDADLWSISGNTETRVLKGKVRGGHIWNGIGEEIEVAREDVDDDCNRHCSYGLHAGSFEYATGFGTRTVLVKFDPKDVVSVPTDCDGQKVRVCKYIVVSEYNENKDIDDAVISDNREHVERKQHSKQDYYDKFSAIVIAYKLTYKDDDVICMLMKESGFDSCEVIQDLLYKLEVADKIQGYVNRKGGEASLKNIQSALKTYKLKQSEIEEIVNKFGHLT
jgi:heme-degrading monooxygenase HmoA